MQGGRGSNEFRDWGAIPLGGHVVKTLAYPDWLIGYPGSLIVISYGADV